MEKPTPRQVYDAKEVDAYMQSIGEPTGAVWLWRACTHNEGGSGDVVFVGSAWDHELDEGYYTAAEALMRVFGEDMYIAYYW